MLAIWAAILWSSWAENAKQIRLARISAAPMLQTKLVVHAVFQILSDHSHVASADALRILSSVGQFFRALDERFNDLPADAGF